MKLDPKLRARLDRLAAAQRRPVESIIHEALSHSLDRAEGRGGALGHFDPEWEDFDAEALDEFAAPAVPERDGPVVYLDTNVIIAFLETPPGALNPARDFIDDALRDGLDLVTSEWTVAECAAGAAAVGRTGDGEKHRANLARYREAFASGFVRLLPFDGALAIRSAETATSLKLALADAIHYVSALEEGADRFVTSDRGFPASPQMAIVRV